MHGKDEKFHDASEDLTRELIESFLIEDPKYLKALSGNYENEEHMSKGVFAPFDNKSELEDMAFALNPERTQYENPIALHYFYCFEYPLFHRMMLKYIKPAKKMFIGCVDKEVAETLFGKIDIYVRTAPYNSYKDIDSWYLQVLDGMHDVDLILPCTGISTRVVQKRIYEAGFKGSSIDFGSIIDSFAGFPTRKWIKKLGLHENRREG